MKVSMEPLLFRNGNMTGKTRKSRMYIVSMEPLLFRNGNLTSSSARVIILTKVSMEPLLFRNGNRYLKRPQ